MFPALPGYHLPTCGVGHVRRAIGRTQIPPNCLTAWFFDLENEDWDQLMGADEFISPAFVMAIPRLVRPESSNERSRGLINLGNDALAKTPRV
jgi:hypothetical protein